MRRLVMVGFFVVAGARPVSAVPVCAATTVAALVGTSCALGDHDFTFTNYLSGGFDWTLNATAGLDPGLIRFTPDASDPFTLRFTLTSPAFRSTSLVSELGRYQFGSLEFTETAQPEALFITSLSTTLMAAAATSGAPLDATHSAVGFASGVLALDCEARAMVAHNVDGPLVTQAGCRNDSAAASQLGFAFWETSAGGGFADASMAGVTYTFGQAIEPVPEPGVWILLLMASLPLVLLRPKPDRRIGVVPGPPPAPTATS